MSSLDALFRAAAEKAGLHQALPHRHSWVCTQETCGVGPSREQLVRDTIAFKLKRNEEFLHYTKAAAEEIVRGGREA